LKSNHPVIRELLKKNPDGLSIKEISNTTNLLPDSIEKSLKGMPDVYIDRWTVAKQQKREEAVWCVVEVPEDCPRPERKERVRPTQFRRMEPRELSQVLHGFVHQNANSAGSY
jgi:hypothetical protein